MKKVVAFGIVVLMALAAFAQTTPRHPRVIELEKYLTAEVQGIIKDIAPSRAFTASVRVEPVHRAGANGAAASGADKEALPYYEAYDEIKDEWDDPNRTEASLLQRVSRISVKIQLPQEIQESQINDIKSLVMVRLQMVEVRDNIDFEKRDWLSPVDAKNYTPWVLGIGVALAGLFGLIFMVVVFLAVGKLSKSISSIKLHGAESNGGGHGGGPMGAISATIAPGAGWQSSGSVQFNDRFKMTEAILTMVRVIETLPTFPTLENMTLIDRYMEEQPKSTAGLLSEFPIQLRDKLFAYSASESWLKAYADTGEIDANSFDLMSKLVKFVQIRDDKNWEELLIVSWRLGPSLSKFLKSMPQDHALAILHALPQSLALGVAKEILPGEWAVLLRNEIKAKKPDVEQVKKYIQAAKEIKALRSTHALERYRRDIELSGFLRTCDLATEKEVYGALPAESVLHQMRPPFYAIFDGLPEDIKLFIIMIPTEEWAMALMNMPKPVRMLVQVHFSERQKLQFVECLRKFDKSNIKQETVGEHREKVAKLFFDYMTLKASNVTAIKPEEKKKAA